MTDEAATEQSHPAESEAAVAPAEASTQVNGEAADVATEMDVADEQQEGKKSEEKEKKSEEEKQSNEENKPEEQEQKKIEAPVQLGPMVFTSGVDMFMYFYQLLHGWNEGLDVNEYEHLVLLDLLNKGHNDPASKIGAGIRAFQVRTHPKWHSKCYYLERTDGTCEDFSYRKCVDKLMYLPPDLMAPPAARGGKGGGKHQGGRGGRGGGRGRGRGRGWRGRS